MAFFQHSSDGHDRGTCLDSGGTGDACNQRLAELLRVAQIRVGLDERLLFHGQIIAKRGKPRNAECTMIDRNGGELKNGVRSRLVALGRIVRAGMLQGENCP